MERSKRKEWTNTSESVNKCAPCLRSQVSSLPSEKLLATSVTMKPFKETWSNSRWGRFIRLYSEWPPVFQWTSLNMYSSAWGGILCLMLCVHSCMIFTIDGTIILGQYSVVSVWDNISRVLRSISEAVSLSSPFSHSDWPGLHIQGSYAEEQWSHRGHVPRLHRQSYRWELVISSTTSRLLSLLCLSICVTNLTVGTYTYIYMCEID